ncbi:LOW QUALITY PROTEIN: uncharacterized protein ACMZJ9_022489 [Mantella aurantiaca]
MAANFPCSLTPSSLLGCNGTSADQTSDAAMRPLHVLLLWALLCLARGNVPSVLEEIFTRPGSDLLLPIRRHLTLNRTDRDKCDEFYWLYRESSGHRVRRIATHWNCHLSDFKYFPNIKISEDGSLIISNVTPENDGMYIMYICNTTGYSIQIDYYQVYIEVPVSVPVMNVSCLQNGSAEISCRVEAGTKPNINLSVIGGSQEKYSASANSITAIVRSPGPWKVTCSVKNGVSQSEESRAGVTCPAPLSDIVVVSSCILNGSVVAICSVKGSDPHYSWSLDGRFVSSHSRVTLPPPVSGTLCCDVTKLNTISVSINVSCAVPVSDPVLDVGCLQNGRAEISCKVEEGTDLSIYLTVNGESEVYNVTGSERTVHVIVPPVSPPNSWNISCWVKNQISQRSSNQTRDSCPGVILDSSYKGACTWSCSNLTLHCRVVVLERFAPPSPLTKLSDTDTYEDGTGWVCEYQP